MGRHATRIASARRCGRWADVLPLVLLATVVACSSGDAAPADGPELDPEAATDGGIDTEFVMPLDAYVPDHEASTTFKQASDILIRDCMVGRGFDVAAVDSFLETASPDPEQLSVAEKQAGQVREILGLTDRREARESGYLEWVTARVEQNRTRTTADPNDPEDSLTARFGPEFMAALGDPGGASGCGGEAGSHLRGDAGGPPVDVAELYHEAVGRAVEDGRVGHTFGAWSECMADRGHDYDTPVEPLREHEQEAGERSGGQTPVPPADEAQIDLALDDVACKDDTDMVGTWFAVLAAHEQDLIDENAEALQDLLDYDAARLRRARDVVDGA